MKTLDEVYKESLDQINQASVINSIAKEIQNVTEALTKAELKNWSADQISRAITTLAVLRVNLGSELADAGSYYDFAYLHRKIRYASEWKPTKDTLNRTMNRATVQDIDSTITGKIADTFEAETKAKHYADKLRIIYDASETLITALQSRLGVLKQERAESRY